MIGDKILFLYSIYMVNHTEGKIDYLKVKNDDDFQEKIIDIFQFLSINHKYNLAGSSHMKPILYNTDFDLNERIVEKDNNESHLERHLKHIANIFQKKFEEAYKNPNMFIIDFKCGVDEHYDPNKEEEREKYILRWDKEDMKKGYKIVWGEKKRYLWECLLDETILKLDIIVLINNIFEDFSEVYFLTIGHHQNHTKITKQEVKESIYENYVLYTNEGKIYKGLKRLYSFYKIESKKYMRQIRVLTEFFNTESGLIYKNKSELGVLVEVLTQKFRKVELEDIRINLQVIKQSLSYVYKLPLIGVSERIDRISSLQSKEKMVEEIESLEKYLEEVINKEASRFKKESRVADIVKKRKTRIQILYKKLQNIYKKTLKKRGTTKKFITNPYSRLSKHMWKRE